MNEVYKKGKIYSIEDFTKLQAEFDDRNEKMTKEEDRRVLMQIKEILESEKWEEFSKPILILSKLDNFFKNRFKGKGKCYV